MYYYTLHIKNETNEYISYAQILDSIIKTKSMAETANNFSLNYENVYNIWLNSTVYSESTKKIYLIKEIAEHMKNNGCKSAFDQYNIQRNQMFSIYNMLCVPNKKYEYVSYKEILDTIKQTKSILQTAIKLSLDYKTVCDIYLKSATNDADQTNVYSVKEITNHICNKGLKSAYEKYKLQYKQLFAIYCTIDILNENNVLISYNDILQMFKKTQ